MISDIDGGLGQVSTVCNFTQTAVHCVPPRPSEMSSMSTAVSPPQPAHPSNCNNAHMDPLHPSVFCLPQTAQLEALYTIIRNKETSRGDFLFYSDRIIRLLVEEGLNHLPVVEKTVETPTVNSH